MVCRPRRSIRPFRATRSSSCSARRCCCLWACVIHSDEQVLSAYTSDFTVVTRADQLSDCDAVVVVSWGVDLALRDQAARQFPRLRTLAAYYPAVVLER